MEHIIKHKIFKDSMRIKLWLYNDLNNSVYTRDVEIDKSFLEISPAKAAAAKIKVRDENGHFIKVITKDLNITSNGDML